ncbi:hypothetical protein BM1_10329 [Bipolaris maydis]|nr:hypothetical protein BM1_10329 [Bipolaris maydis]
MAPSDDAKRATTILTIAQLKFKQAIKKTDNEDRLPPVSVEISSQLFSGIDAVLQQNTRVNVQKCTEWIVKHIAPSKARIALLGDYLISVSKSIVLDLNNPVVAKKAVRNRMDLLLIVNDVLHTDKFHRRSAVKQGIFSDVCGSFVAELIEQAAVCMTEKDSQPEKKLKAIINYWAVNQLVSADCLKLCRDRADEVLSIAHGGTPVRKRNYLLPEYHGDRTAPWYDLPASYMLEPMIKHPNRPIDPSQIKIQKLDKKPVSPHVRNLLDNFFEKIDLKYRPTGDNPTGETAKYKLSLDPMGQLVKQDKETGETTTVANGYGWSMKFCQDMQKHGVPENIKIAREDIERMEGGAQLVTHDAVTDRLHRIQTTDEGGDITVGAVAVAAMARSRLMIAVHHLDGQDLAPGRKNTADLPPNQHTKAMTNLDSYQDHRIETEASVNHSGVDQGVRTEALMVVQASAMPPQNFGQPYSQSPQPSFNAPPFPPQPGQFPIPMPPFGIPPPPPPQFQGAGAFVPPPPPPNYTGPWPPPPNMSVPANSSQHGNQYGNSNNGSYNQNQGGYQGGRGYGSPQRGGYNNNRGSWRGAGRGGRY